MAMVPITASAHARLVTSNPAPGVTLDAAPAIVDLYFSEPVTPAGRGVAVYGPDGTPAQAGPAAAQGDRLSVALASRGLGTYAVIWTVVAADTHPSRGELTFNVGHPSPVRAPGLGTGDLGLVSPIGLAMQALGRWLHFAGFALGFGVAIYSLFVARVDGPPLRLAGAGVTLLLAAEPLALLAQTASFDPSQAFDGDALTGALASPFGRVLGLRLAAALLLWAVLGGLKQAPWLRWSIPALAVALSIVDATAAHATPALSQPLGLALNAVHILAMSTWIGGLAAFALAPSAVFERVAAWSVGLLLLSGAALALLHFGQWQDLMTTAYGQSLIVKIPLVASALYLARLGRRRWELVALAAVLGVAATLVSLPPPR
jgi:copper transport protein